MEKDKIIELQNHRIESLEKQLKELKKRIPNSQKKITRRRVENIKNFFLYEEQIIDCLEFLIDEAKQMDFKRILITPIEIIEKINTVTPTDMNVNSCGRILTHLYPNSKMKVDGVTKYNILL